MSEIVKSDICTAHCQVNLILSHLLYMKLKSDYQLYCRCLTAHINLVCVQNVDSINFFDVL